MMTWHCLWCEHLHSRRWLCYKSRTLPPRCSIDDRLSRGTLCISFKLILTCHRGISSQPDSFYTLKILRFKVRSTLKVNLQAFVHCAGLSTLVSCLFTWNWDCFWLQKLKKLPRDRAFSTQSDEASLSRYSPYGIMSSPKRGSSVLMVYSSWTEWLLYLWAGWRRILCGWVLSDSDQDRNHCLHYQDTECSW